MLLTELQKVLESAGIYIEMWRTLPQADKCEWNVEIVRKILSQIEIKGKDKMFQEIKIRFKCTLEIIYTWSIFTVSTKADYTVCHKAHPDTFKGENAFSK